MHSKLGLLKRSKNLNGVGWKVYSKDCCYCNLKGRQREKMGKSERERERERDKSKKKSSLNIFEKEQSETWMSEHNMKHDRTWKLNYRLHGHYNS